MRKEILAEINRWLAIDFWETEYIKRNFYLNNIESFGVLRKCIDVLYSIQIAGYGEDTLRYSMNAILRQKYDNNSRFDVSFYSKEQIKVMEYFVAMSREYGYYPWDLVSWVRSRLLISCLYRKKELPRPPMAFSGALNTKFILKNMMLDLKFGIIKDNGSDYELPEAEIPILFSHDGVGLKRARIIDMHRKYVYNFFQRETGFSVKELKSFLSLRHDVNDASFQSKSNMSRAIGLYIWDRKTKRGVSAGSVITTFLSSRLSQQICDDIGLSREASTLRQWYRNTRKSIEKKTVLTI